LTLARRSLHKESEEPKIGWLFGWDTRKELIDHLTNDNLKGSPCKMLAHCCVGNNLWAVIECPEDGRFIALFMMKGRNGSRDGWGYKDLDEGCGPYHYNCPLKYIDMVKDFEPRSYAKEWREQVREYWAKRSRKFPPGTRIKLYGREYEVTGRPYRNKLDYAVKDLECGGVYRMKSRQVTDAEVLT
jgi:hypothetical protein